MGQQNSFDIVSEVDLQEVDNALNQARKEVAQRYDLKDSKSSIDFDPKEKVVTVTSLNEFNLKSVVDVLQNKFVKRGIHLKSLVYGSVDAAAGGSARQKITVKIGIDKENAKNLVKLIKDSKRKVQAQIMEEQVRVSGKDRDELQAVIALLKAADFPLPLQFTNYRS
ncbi:MAG TPA: YajQ family cyclic di-GMP-binding protein [Bacteroidota bacterium]|nr:YajQ family cyclic di-GMP-binding protein [Bacteroidota bacterium]